MSALAITVPAGICSQIRAHVAEQADGHEAVGRLVVRSADGVAVTYERIRNRSSRPGTATFAASWPPLPGRFSTIVHSHPGNDPRPSERDLAWTSDRSYRGREYRSVFGIFSGDFLHIFRLTDFDARTFEEVRVVMEREA